MSQIEFPTKTVEFTLHLPLPDKTHPKYEAYQASVDAMKKHMAVCDDNMFPSIQITTEYKTVNSAAYFTWNVSLLYQRDPNTTFAFLSQDAICSYGDARDKDNMGESLEALASYTQEYKKLVFTLDTDDSYALIQGAPVTIRQEVPYSGYNNQ